MKISMDSSMEPYWKQAIAKAASSNSNRRRLWGLMALVIVATMVYWYNNGEDDIYSLTPFCDEDGTCHEKPEKASPRTVYSARSKEQFIDWWDFHAHLNSTAEAYSNKRLSLLQKTSEESGSTRSTRPLILLGDSITESWIGSDLGQPIPRARDVPGVLTELLQTPPWKILDPLVLGVSGDQTQHLLYRLSHGHLLPGYSEDPTAIFVVLIGTNNLGSGELPGPAAKGVLAVADYILSQTKGQLLLLKVLPRGDAFRLARICPPRCNSEGKPFSSFEPAVAKLNKDVEAGVMELAERYDSRRIELLDCGASFRGAAGTENEVEPSLMPDLLHPNAAGHRIMGKCFLNYIAGLEKG